MWKCAKNRDSLLLETLRYLRKVTSINTSRLEASSRFFRLFINVYILWNIKKNFRKGLLRWMIIRCVFKLVWIPVLYMYVLRDVSAGATGATAVAPKFSDTLTLSQSGGGGRFCPPSQRSNLNFPRGYVPGTNRLIEGFQQHYVNINI